MSVTTTNNTTTNTNIIPANGTNPADIQLNENFAAYTKILIDALKNGLIPVKNANRIQNLTVDDIVEIVKNKLPVQNISNYITENSTNVIEMVQSYNIIRDTKFVTTDYLPFRIIQRREQDLINDPSGATYIDVDYLKVKLPKDLSNKDRIVQVYVTNKNDQSQLTLKNDTIFDYYIDIDPTDTTGCYILEARAASLNINKDPASGETYIIDAYTNPLEPNFWGTWAKNEFIKVTYLVDTNWFSNENPMVTPDPTVRVAKTTSVKVTPMNFGLQDVTEPNESIQILPSSKNHISLLLDDDINPPLIPNKTYETKSEPRWIVVSDKSGIDLLTLDYHLQNISRINRLISQDIDPNYRTPIIEWKQAKTENGCNLLYTVDPNRIINQLTYNLAVQTFQTWGNKVGLPKYIIEYVTDNTIVIEAISNLKAYKDILADDTEAELIIKFDKGTQYPFIVCKVLAVPTRIIEFTGLNKTNLLEYASVNFVPTRIIEEVAFYMRTLNGTNGIYTSTIYLPVRIINWLESTIRNLDRYTKPYFKPNRIIEETSISTDPTKRVLGKVSKSYFRPTRIIEEDATSKLVKQTIPITFKTYKRAAKIIEMLNTLSVTLERHHNRIKDKVRMVIQDEKVTSVSDSLAKEKVNILYKPARYVELQQTFLTAQNRVAKLANKINKIIEQTNEVIPTNFSGVKTLAKLTYKVSRFIEQNGHNLLDPKEIVYDESGNEDQFSMSRIYNNVMLYRPTWLASQETIFPIHMSASAGSIEYLTDNYNAYVVSSLAREEFIPLITAEGKMFRSEYEFFATQDQTVFNVKHNTDLVSVYRQGFKLSRGDYYSNGYNIILKSPANAGEIINIISDRRYTYSETVSKEDLFNAINQLKTDKPIITFPSFGYENSSVEIKINNYDPTINYQISMKIDNLYKEDISWYKKGDTYYVDLPEVVNASRRTFVFNIWATSDGRLQSAPTEGSITVKNLFDFSLSDPLKTHRIVFGTTPDEWTGLANKIYTFSGQKTSKSVFDAIYSDGTYNNRIAIKKDNWYQNNIIDTKLLNSTNLESYVNMENLGEAKFEILSSNGFETKFKVPMSTINIGQAALNHDDLGEAFSKGKLYCIVDSSTYVNMYNQIINTGYKTNKYNYIPLNEFTSSLNILPIDGNTWILEHNSNLKTRVIHGLLYVDFEFLVDFDYENFTQISEDTIVTSRTINYDSMEYKLIDNVPILNIKVNDPRVTSLTNPYVGIGSNIKLNVDQSNILDIQTANPKALTVNNISAERIFDGTRVKLDNGLLGNSVTGDDSFNGILNDTKHLRNFKITSQDGIYNTTRLNDQLYLSDENITKDSKVRIVLNRFYNTNIRTSDVPSYKNKLKLVYTLPSIDDSSFKSLAYIYQKTHPNSLGFKSNYGLLTFGGTGTYRSYTQTGYTDTDYIESKITFQRLFIEDKSNLTTVTNEDGIHPFKDGHVLNPDAVVDGYKCMEGELITKKIPNWWDVVTIPSVRTERYSYLKDFWLNIVNGTDATSPTWNKINFGLIRKSKVLNIDQNFTDKDQTYTFKNWDILPVPDQSQLLIFGGETYKTTVSHVLDESLTQSFVTDNKLTYYGEALADAYSQKSGTWKGKTDIVAIDYGFDDTSKEPYVEYAWAKHFTFSTFEIQDSKTIEVFHDGLKFYIHRVSRVLCKNTKIYHINLTGIEDYNPGPNDIYPSFITEITNASYTKLFGDDILKVPSNKGIDLTKPNDVAVNNATIREQDINFIDSIYDSGSIWLFVKDSGQLETKLYNLNPNGLGISNSGTYFTDKYVNVKSLLFNQQTLANVSKDFGNGQGTTTYWKFIPNILGVLLDAGPLFTKVRSRPIGTSLTKETGTGIYQFDYLNTTLKSKVLMDIDLDKVLVGVPEYAGIRNPFIIEIGKDTKNMLNLVGVNFNLTIYLDKFLSLLTKRQFNQFKEEIFNLNLGLTTVNPNKELIVLENIIPIGIKAIVPENDDYHSNSATVILNRVSTQTGGLAENLVFRLTNKSKFDLSVDSIRFKLF